MHFLISGHTGFKGAWLVIMLKELGHKVSGVSLDPLPGSLFELGNVEKLLEHDVRVDIRNLKELEDAFALISPDVVMHLAAQPLVRESYLDPRGTMESNVIGTMNMLTAVGKTSSVKAHVVITTDKVYKNIDQIWGYKEIDPLGGDDPYSASKAMADILTQSWIKSFGGPPTAIARAGNVIGGGDVSKDRLLPDLIRGYSEGEIPELRFPDAVRPWQHVLDCLNGYIALSTKLLKGEGTGEWNFGPDTNSFVSVGVVASIVAKMHGVEKDPWTVTKSHQPHEANLLSLDARKAELQLDWGNKLSFMESLQWTVEWHQRLKSGDDALELTKQQIRRFLNISSGELNK
jgi:CDP-glucose 4,6-dehydratase